MSASSNTITGALPPSSRCTRLRVSAAARATSLPVATSPVSETIATSGCRTSPAPAGGPPRPAPPGLAVPEDHVEDALGQVLRGDLGKARSRHRRLFGGLQDH